MFLPVRSASLIPFLFVTMATIACAQTVLVNEQFTDGERSTQAAPDSLQWTYGAHHATAANAFTSLDASNGALVWDHTNNGNSSFSGIWAHFAPGNAPIVLAVGETLQLSFEVRFSGGTFGGSANAFRWALFDSNNSRTTTDFAGFNATGLSSGSTFGPWKGYLAQTAVMTTDTVGPPTNTFVVRERTGTQNALFQSDQYVDISGSAVNELLFAADVTYSGLLSLTRTASGMAVQASIGGLSTNLATDSGSPFVEFDTVAFFSADALAQNITLDNVQVQIVPEPATATMLAAGVLGLAARRRRKG